MSAHYRILAPLGQGGLARVFRGEDLARREEVALKQPKHQDEEHLARLADELRLGRQLRHRNLVETRELVELEETPTLVLSLVPGVPLSKLMKQGPLAPRQVTRIGAQISSALGYMHTALDRDGRPLYAVHRDLSLGNVMWDESRERATLIDLGLCAQMSTFKTESQDTLMGTLRYLAPEVLTSRKWSPASDFWSLGVILLELTLGRKMFQGTEAQIIGQIVTCAFLHNEDWLKIPPGLARALRAFLEPEPAGRVRTANEAIAYLAQASQYLAETNPSLAETNPWNQLDTNSAWDALPLPSRRAEPAADAAAALLNDVQLLDPSSLLTDPESFEVASSSTHFPFDPSAASQAETTASVELTTSEQIRAYVRSLDALGRPPSPVAC